MFDSSGDRVQNYTLWQLHKGRVTFTPLLEVRLGKSITPLPAEHSSLVFEVSLANT